MPTKLAAADVCAALASRASRSTSTPPAAAVLPLPPPPAVAAAATATAAALGGAAALAARNAAKEAPQLRANSDPHVALASRPQSKPADMPLHSAAGHSAGAAAKGAAPSKAPGAGAAHERRGLISAHTTPGRGGSAPLPSAPPPRTSARAATRICPRDSAAPPVQKPSLAPSPPGDRSGPPPGCASAAPSSSDAGAPNGTVVASSAGLGTPLRPPA